MDRAVFVLVFPHVLPTNGNPQVSRGIMCEPASVQVFTFHVHILHRITRTKSESHAAQSLKPDETTYTCVGNSCNLAHHIFLRLPQSPSVPPSFLSSLLPSVSSLVPLGCRGPKKFPITLFNSIFRSSFARSTWTEYNQVLMSSSLPGGMPLSSLLRFHLHG